MRWFVALLMLAGCYHPKIPDQSFQCGSNGQCPSGFACNAERLCQKGHSSDGGVSGLYAGLLGAKDLTGMTGDLLCSTKTGEMILKGDDGSMTVILGTSLPGFARLAQTSGPLLGTWSFSSLAIPSGITVKPSSDSDAMPVFASSGSMDIEAVVDWRGFGGFPGISDGGGQSKSSGVLSGGGAGVNGGGGGGAGSAFDGDSAMGAGGGQGGMKYGSDDVMILHAGSGGGGGGSSMGATAEGGLGGNGAGAVALLAMTTLTIGGSINVSGNPGNTATGNGGGGGGGSGGTLLLSAPTVTFSAGVSLTATGGTGGAGAGTGAVGANGSSGRILVAGTISVGAVDGGTDGGMDGGMDGGTDGGTLPYLTSPTADTSFPVGATAAP